jgi:hypothetical protein
MGKKVWREDKCGNHSIQIKRFAFISAFAGPQKTHFGHGEHQFLLHILQLSNSLTPCQTPYLHLNYDVIPEFFGGAS